MTDDPAEDEIGEPGVDVTDLLVATYRRGQRDAFAEAAKLADLGSVLIKAGRRPEYEQAAIRDGLRKFAVVLRKLADAAGDV